MFALVWHIQQKSDIGFFREERKKKVKEKGRKRTKKEKKEDWKLHNRCLAKIKGKDEENGKKKESRAWLWLKSVLVDFF